MSDNKRHKVYVVGGGFDYIKLMYRLGYDGARGLDEADIVLFTGGSDVNPELYGQPCMAKTNFDRARDTKELIIYHGALDREIPMIGICRGGQLLNVANGGSTWQHVSGHALGMSHSMLIEIPPFLNGNKRRSIQVTSTHHQMMIPTEEAIILGTSLEALEKHSPTELKIGRDINEPDTEVVWYDDTHCLCFQPHPEYSFAPAECVDFFEECVDNFVVPMIPGQPKKKPTLSVKKKQAKKGK